MAAVKTEIDASIVMHSEAQVVDVSPDYIEMARRRGMALGRAIIPAGATVRNPEGMYVLNYGITQEDSDFSSVVIVKASIPEAQARRLIAENNPF